MGKAVTGINCPNQTGYFLPADKNWEIKMLPMKASLAMAEGVAITAETSGAAVTGYYRTQVAVGNIAGDDTMGILAEPILATDADYATAGKMKAVYVPTTPEAVAYFYVGAGTFTTADVGATVALHSDFKSLAVDTLGLGATIVGYIDATHGTCKFNLPKTQVA
jgi:hypothetical protein